MKFELNSLPRNCSDEDVSAEIKRVDALVGKNKLTQTDYEKYAKISSDGVTDSLRKLQLREGR